MRPHNLPIDKPILLSSAILGVTLLIIGLFKNVINPDSNNSYITLLYGTSIFFSVLPWSVALIDVIRSRMFNKTAWIFGLLFTGPVATIAYFYNRDKILKYYDSINN